MVSMWGINLAVNCQCAKVLLEGGGGILLGDRHADLGGWVEGDLLPLYKYPGYALNKEGSALDQGSRGF